MAEPQLVTFGCRLNAYESEVMRGHAVEAGLTNAIIFNTCAVTGEAERQARQAIRRARRENPNAEIIVTGCAAEVSAASFAAMPEITRLIGNSDKLKPEAWATRIGFTGTDIMTAREAVSPTVEGFSGLARGFVQAQTGCDHRCTFCIIPFGRGPSRSVPLGEIVAQTRRLVEAGYNEIVLTGVDITSFGGDLPGKPTLGSAVKRLLTLVPELPRLRLSSLDPAAIDEDLWDLIANEPRLMPHLHLSLQAGNDIILKRMKRRHSRAEALEVCERARQLRPGVTLGVDIIAGFPTESEEMAADTADFIAEADLTFLHVFPYSPRAGTPAARMPQLPRTVIKERAASLRQIGDKVLQKYIWGRIGEAESILVEAKGVGRTAYYAEVVLPESDPVGSVVTRRISHAEGRKLVACE
jgi:threonylcarbamoyladenosine tRNA methylthiotransferase MtaB